MVAFEDVGPAADFGSLSAFLGVGVPGPEGVRLKAPVPLPPHAGQTPAAGRPGKDGTLLNKKVAFRMLKQLGCEVREDDNEVRYIQVGIKTQPVLFKMLVELGHAPRRTADGDFMVQVVEQRPRKTEDLVAALSAPRKPPRGPRQQEPEPEEGYPAVGRPRLRPEDEQQLVSRLYKVPRRPVVESGAAKAEADKPRRTAAEQRAYLDRLVKPRDREEELAPELDEAMVEAGRRLLKNGITWPTFSSRPAEKERAPRPSKEEREPREPKETREPKERRSRLAHAGLLAISSGSLPGSPKPERPLSPAGATPTPPTPEVPEADPLPKELPAQARPETQEAEAQAEAEQGAEAEAVPEAVPEAEAEAESTGQWLERLLGPAKVPGRERRSCKEQRERLQALARPRQVKEPEQVVLPSKPRSPRSQREACKRLAQPRKPRAMDEALDAEAPDGADEPMDRDFGDFADLADDAGEEVGDGGAGGAGGAGAPPVKIIPSLLAQCPSRLERIDEEADAKAKAKAKAQAQARRKSPRARSQGAQGAHGAQGKGRSAPYAVPVVPKHLVDPPRADRDRDRSERERSARGGEKAQRPTNREEDLSEEEMAKLASLLAPEFPEAASEAMLRDIDVLYSQLMASTPHESQSRYLDSGSMDPDLSSAPAPEPGSPLMARNREGREGREGQEGGEGEEQEQGAPEAPEAPAAPEGRREGPEGEELLADIDRLYVEMLGKGGPEEPPEPRERAGLGSAGPAGSAGSAEAAEATMAAEEGAEELSALLEEVLWSALLLTRGAAGKCSQTAEACLLQLLPPAQLTQASLMVAVPSSLLQRLEVELPKAHAALAVAPSAKPRQDRPLAAVLQAVRQARDQLLSSAASPRPEAFKEVSRPSSGRSRNSSGTSSKRLRSKPRRSSMSYWTDESLDALEAPKRLVPR